MSTVVLARPGAIVNHLYFANSSFVHDSTVIVSSNHDNAMAFYSVAGDTWTKLAEMSAFDPQAAPNARPNINFRYSGVIAHAINRFFWVDGNAICSCDAHTGGQQRRVILDGVKEIGEPLSYYPGGEFIFFFVIVDGKTTFGRMQIESSRIEWGPKTDFCGNHVQAFTRDGRQFLFARESSCINGVWYHNPYRVWVGDFKTGKIWPYYQHIQHGQDLFEHIGHEMADYATDTVIAARYKSSPVGAPGIVRLRTGREPEMLWAGSAWHPAISLDGRWMICDCQPEHDRGHSPLILVDLVGKTSRVVGQSFTYGGHPYHPHPCIDVHGRHIAYIERDQQGNGACVHVMAL